ncbi:hypothetical protein H6G00_01815 [Leptolyngbya sp. FACHB-541]|uniref:hypothetical protein n=1 Tax=Leptolyngbya sp. FACHB-541 TaxID=2692810 RepID=UPI00168531EA|nr:hypothetical protein [Leptolyngbya sp. FACHB-541]MBD1995368.1 hypothetical protein [Leptolyngbya sp. FACHB-541]
MESANCEKRPPNVELWVAGEDSWLILPELNLCFSKGKGFEQIPYEQAIAGKRRAIIPNEHMDDFFAHLVALCDQAQQIVRAVDLAFTNIGGVVRDFYSEGHLQLLGSAELLMIACDGLGLYPSHPSQNYPLKIDFTRVIQDIMAAQYVKIHDTVIDNIVLQRNPDGSIPRDVLEQEVRRFAMRECFTITEADEAVRVALGIEGYKA